MRLSEAIRLGSMLRGQAFEDYFDNSGSCAIGAALEAAGLRDAVRDGGCAVAEYENRHRAVFVASCPSCGRQPGMGMTSFMNTVIHLNDDHRWTREAIADWVAGIEPVEAVTDGSEAARAVTGDVLQAAHALVEVEK